MTEASRRLRIAALLLGGALALLGAPQPAAAISVVDNGSFSLDLSGDIKGRFVAIFPYEHLFMPDEAIGQAGLLGRARLELRVGRWLALSAHHQLGANIVSGDLPLTGALLGDPTAAGSPEAIELSWSALDESSGFSVRGRMDRLSLRLRLPHMDFTVGRQPVSFGSAWFFTPLDLVAPFSPTVIDREYKPGVDAVRADFYIGTAGQVTAVAAYAGSWGLDGLVLAAHGRVNVGLWDISLLLAAVHEDFVVGLDAAGSIGDISVRAAVTYTVPPEDAEDEEPFLRLVFGADYRFQSGITVLGEVYYQGIGESRPSRYLAFASSDRFSRGELWSMGRLYGALSVAAELNPIVSINAAITVNILDGSALFSPGLSWSISGNADLVVGAMFALGQRPAPIELANLFGSDGLPMVEEDFAQVFRARSEFGLLPHTAYLQINSYF